MTAPGLPGAAGEECADAAAGQDRAGLRGEALE